MFLLINQKKVTGIILVAGNSTRYGTGKNKNFELINEKPILFYSIYAYEKNAYIDDIIVAVKESEKEIVHQFIQKEKLSKNIQIVIGGRTRQESVLHCVSHTDADIVIIHDGARPMIKQEYITKCIESMNLFCGVTIGVKSKDTIKIVDDDGIVLTTTKRENTYIIQTPQCFDRKTLLYLHEKYADEEVTDDCSLLEKEGMKVKILDGDYTNIKITTPEDFICAKEYINL